MMRKHKSLSVCRYLAHFAIFALWGTGLFAQEPATSLDQLNLIMGEGDKITLVDSSGKKISGKVNRLAPDGIDLVVSGNLKTFSEKDIQRITRNRPDSPINGFLIGFGIGLGSTLPLSLAYADNEGVDTGLAVLNSALWGLVGGGIGALVDASIHKKQLVYLRKERAVSWGIRPLFAEPTQQPALAPRAFLTGAPFHAGIGSVKGLAVNIRF